MPESGKELRSRKSRKNATDEIERNLDGVQNSFIKRLWKYRTRQQKKKRKKKRIKKKEKRINNKEKKKKRMKKKEQRKKS